MITYLAVSSRWVGLGIGVIVVALGGIWFGVNRPTNRDVVVPKSGSVQVQAGSLDDLLMDLQLLPLDGQPPKPFTLQSLDGRRVALSDLAGRPALLYFWATW